jgi:demethylmenaquinone methyltransferase / 2-methoxy-6-polyprenyl-1,4-benzoquinol methylase
MLDRRASAMRSSCSAASRAAMTSSRLRSASGRIRAGGGRWCAVWRPHVATGTGLVAAELLRQGADSLVAIDQSAEMLGAARARFTARRASERSEHQGAAPRIEFVQAEAERLPFSDGSFDALTFTYLLRYVDDPAATMRELARVLRPGGRIASLEFGVPSSLLARGAWRAYTAIGLPFVGRLFSREWGEVGRFLGPSIVDFYQRHPVERIVGYWRDAGLQDVQVRRMSLGGGVLMFATRAAGQAPAGARADAD